MPTHEHGQDYGTGTSKPTQYFERNQSVVQCACLEVDYGGCHFGIFSAATPVEPLHALEKWYHNQLCPHFV
jgi:hypothetical protein